MKINCHNCHARYAIPDERVTGRVLQVRCKRCSEVMKVVGPTAAYAEGEHRPPPTMTGIQAYRPEPTQTQLMAGEGPRWWAGIAGTPHGPYTPDQLKELIRRGDIHARTYLWAKGMPNWERIEDSDRLAFAHLWVLDHGSRRAALQGMQDLHDAPWRPEPTQHSGWIVLDERTQAYLETCARRGAREELGFQAAIGLGVAGLSLAVGGVMWLTQFGAV